MRSKAAAAEFIGTFMLMAAILAANFYGFDVRIGGAGILGVALAVGLTVTAMAYAVGHVSGGHFNPAITLGLVAAGRFDTADAALYIPAQCLGALAAALFFFWIGHAPATFAANGYGELSPLKLGLAPVFAAEVVTTALLMIVVTGSTARDAAGTFAPIAVGLTVTVLHIMTMPISNTSINPARSLAPALFAGPAALSQVWVFWAAPILGAVVGGLIGRWLSGD